MKIKILGTAAAEGIPGVFCTCHICENARKNKGKEIRTRSQSLINNQYMIDFPPDSYFHSFKEDIKLGNIEHMLITHQHRDHFFLEDLFYRRKIYGHHIENHLLNIYAPKTLVEKYQNHPDLHQDYIKLHTLEAFKTYQIGALTVTPLTAHHAPTFECFIYMIEQDEKRLLYGHDSGIYPQETMDFIKDFYFDCVIFDTTNGTLTFGGSHMGVEDNKKLKQKMVVLGCADEKTSFVMSHFSHNGDLTHAQLEEIGKRNGFTIAYDGIEINL